MAVVFLLVAAYIAAAVRPWPLPAGGQPAPPLPPAALPPAALSHGALPVAGDLLPAGTGQPPSGPFRPAAGAGPQQDSPAGPARPRTGTSLLANDYVVRFQRSEDLRAFLRQARRHGLRVADASEALLTVRFHARDLAPARAFLESLAPADLHENVAVEIPDAPAPALLAPPFAYQPFGRHALAWLGRDSGQRSGGEGVTVAVLDTGVSSHPALDPQRIVRIDLLDPQDGAAGEGPFAGHGTAVAALIAGNGEEGVGGMAPGATILDIRVLDARGRGDGFTVAKGVVTAVDNGAEVINLSLGSYGMPAALAAAVEYALARGVAVVAATGNDGGDEVMFPARHPGVIGVAAVDALGQHLAFSNSGPGVDIAAPGFGVTTAWSGNATVAFSGTSAAAPFVSGTIAALLAADPGMTPNEAARLALAYANDAGPPGADQRFGLGILNWRRIVDRDTPGIYDLAVADHYLPVPQLPPRGGTVPVLVLVENRGTEYVGAARLEVTIGGVTEQYLIHDLEPNQSASVRAAIAREQISAAGTVTISSTVSLPFASDGNPANDRLADEFLFVDACPHPAGG